MVKHISCDTAILIDPGLAPSEIDRCLQTMLDERRPCYIGVPVDVSNLFCDDVSLKLKLRREPLPNNPGLEEKVVEELRKEMNNAKKPTIVIDGNAVRGDVVGPASELSSLTGYPTFVTVMGKGGFDETKDNFGGLYAGSGSAEGVTSALEASDTILWIGPYPVCP